MCNPYCSQNKNINKLNENLVNDDGEATDAVTTKQQWQNGLETILFIMKI